MTSSEVNLPTLAKYYLLLGERIVWLGRQSIEFVGTHNIADFIIPVKFSTVQREYTGAQFITPRTYTHYADNTIFER